MAEGEDQNADRFAVEPRKTLELFDVVIPESLVLTVKVDDNGVRTFYLNGLELKQMLPEWSIKGFGAQRVHFTCTLEVELDPQSNDPKSVTEETVYYSGDEAPHTSRVVVSNHHDPQGH